VKLTCNLNRNITIRLLNTLIYGVFLLSVPVQGQTSSLSDTVKIREVVISRPKLLPALTGYKTTEFDSSVLVTYSNKNLTEVLSENTGIYVKSYGTSGVASLSFRGTGSSQTVIDWNGIRINSPMLGQADLSTIPIGMIDNVQLYYGGASMKLDNGGIGGIINLETKPVWKKETSFSLNSAAGSFGDYSGLVKVRTGNTHFQSVTKAYFRSAENNFRYLTSEGVASVWTKRSFAQFSNRGFSQEVYYRTSENVISARIWYESSDRNLPPTRWEKQNDESLRIMVNDNLTKGSTSYFVTVAGLLERLNYRFIGVDSRNLSKTIVFKAGRKSQISENTRLDIIVNNELSYVNSNNYLKRPVHDVATITMTLEKACVERIGMTFLLREILNNYKFLIPDFSSGLQLRLIDNKDYFLKANISRNSRIPTMNDLYWPILGNPDLKNEYAFMYELSGEMKQEISASLSIKSSISVFRNSIKDMIQWDPGQNQLWTVYNLSRVNATGLETGITLAYSINKVSARLSAGYTLTNSITKASPVSDAGSIGKQLIYIPVNQANGSLRVALGNLYSSWATVFSGKRYTATDNSHSLPYYLINNASIGYRLPLNYNSIDINFNVNNLFGVNYQSVANYPMPRQSYMIKLLLQFNK
jgi:vitamin B12 transporter